MPGRSSFFINPGDVSVDIIEAVKRALSFRLQRVRQYPPVVSQVRQSLSAVKPTMRQLAYYPVKPVRQYLNHKIKQQETKKQKSKRIKRELLDAGVTFYGLMKAESRYLPKILHDNEHIMAAIYGQHSSSSAMLIATDERIIYLDKKPMTELFDEVSYEVVSGIKFDIHLFYATVVLHTPVKNYDFKFVNLHCAEKFARYIESQRLEQHQQIQEDQEDMAGYYLLSAEEEERLRTAGG